MKSTSFIIPAFIILFSASLSAQKKDLIADGAELTLVADGFNFTEGPASDEEGNVFFTDQPNNQILKWSAADNAVSVYMENAGRANGLFFDNEGNLLACADEQSELWKIDEDKNITVLVDNFQGKRLNAPNDLWIDAKGGVYFTDPFYRRAYWDHKEQPIKSQRVYYLSPDRKEVKIAAEDLVKPNGIIGTPDGKSLYVADIEDNKTWRYLIAEDGSLSGRELFTQMGSDGMTIDNQGNVYLTGKGVTVFNSKGENIFHIPVDENWTANVTFGGKDRSTLFITAMDSLYSLEMRVKGTR